MRVYILDRDIERMCKKLPAQENYVLLNQAQNILASLIGGWPEEYRRVVQTVPEYAMWIGNESCLFTYCATICDYLGELVKTSKYSHMNQVWRGLERRQKKLFEDMYRPGHNDWPMTNPIANASDELLVSHTVAYVAENPAARLEIFPMLWDLSQPYMAGDQKWQEETP